MLISNTDIAFRLIKSFSQGYLAYRGMSHLYLTDDVKRSSAYVKICDSTGIFFIGFNIFDEIGAIVNHDGIDSHIHHIMCAMIGTINMYLLRTTDNNYLRESMMDSFMILLANEVVTLPFNLYSFLKLMNKQRSLKSLIILVSLLPILKFRAVNSFYLLNKILYGPNSDIISKYMIGIIYQVSTSLLCTGLLVLDGMWMRWALIRIWIVLNKGKIYK